MSRLERFPAVARPKEIDDVILWLRDPRTIDWCPNGWSNIQAPDAHVILRKCALHKLWELCGSPMRPGGLDPERPEPNLDAVKDRFGLVQDDIKKIVGLNDGRADAGGRPAPHSEARRPILADWLEARFA